MRNPRGFTLIEVVVAAAIFGMAATSIFALLSGSIANLRKIDDLRQYQIAGEDIMNRVLLLSKLPPGGTIEGRLEDPPARWIVQITPWIPSKLESNVPEAVMKIDVEVLWNSRSGERKIELETVKGVNLSYANDDFKQAIQNALPQ